MSLLFNYSLKVVNIDELVRDALAAAFFAMRESSTRVGIKESLFFSISLDRMFNDLVLVIMTVEHHVQ